MNFFCDSKGAVFHVDPEPIYQNSAGANELYFIGAFPSSAQVTVAYKLPNGLYTKPKLMTNVTDSTLEITDQYGKGFSVWKEVIGQSVTTDDAGNIVYGQDYTVTENYGKVDVQFVVYANGQGASRLGTASSSFEIGKGVPIILPDSVENDILSQIVASLQTILQGVTQNTDDIDILQEKTETNGNDIEELKGVVKSNREDININRERIATNEIDISKNTDDILKNTTHIALLTDVQLQSGLQYVQPIEDEYNERITANGESVLDWQGNGSKARLLKVVGNTKASSDYIGLKNSMVQGIISKNVDGIQESVLSLPAPVDCGLGTTIDFENQKIIDYGVEITLTGEETLGFSDYRGMNGVFFYQLLPNEEKLPKGVSTDGNVVEKQFVTPNDIWVGVNTRSVTWLGILDILGYTDNWVDKTAPTTEEKEQAFANFKAYLAQRYADGNPVKIRYVSSVVQSEIPFTDEQKAVGNEYTAWRDGIEKILNENAIYGILPELTQEYVVVAEMGDISQDAVNNQINEALKGEY